MPGHKIMPFQRNHASGVILYKIVLFYKTILFYIKSRFHIKSRHHVFITSLACKFSWHSRVMHTAELLFGLPASKSVAILAQASVSLSGKPHATRLMVFSGRVLVAQLSSLGFVLWPPSLLGCGGRQIPMPRLAFLDLFTLCVWSKVGHYM